MVSTQGEGDEEALEQAINSDALYVAFVASKTKATKVLEFLKGRGVSQERIRRVRAPAGLNIGATSPEEIAVSILAEIVQMRANCSEVRRAACTQFCAECDSNRCDGSYLRHDGREEQGEI